MAGKKSTRIEEFVRTRDLAALRADLRAAGGPLVEPAGERRSGGGDQRRSPPAEVTAR